jgi:hypothetical protein
MLLSADVLRPKFRAGLSYAEFVALGEPQGHRPPWDQRYAQLALAPAQEDLVRSFTRDERPVHDRDLVWRLRAAGRGDGPDRRGEP